MVTDRLIDLMTQDNQLLPYLDMPLQHADPTVLKAMSRPSNIEWVSDTISKMRRLIPNIVVRTTMIVGYPNESERSFEILRDFIQEIEFDHLGIFTYSPEMGTSSNSLGDPVPMEVKEARKAELMQLQAGISLTRLKKLQGKIMDMLVEGINPEERLLVGRTYRDAPEIDGLAIAVGDAHEGELVSIQVTNTTEYDIIGEQRKT
jgi:ribosomal protein S12 methylthiotransferase